MNYKIIEVNLADGWVLIEYTDEAETRTKRMMADLTSLDTIDQAVQQWYAQYAADRPAVAQLNPAITDAIAKGTMRTVTIPQLQAAPPQPVQQAAS